MHPFLSSPSHSRLVSDNSSGAVSRAAATHRLSTPKPHRRSESIPISCTMKRTPSEQQLHEDEEMADWRDYIVFSRIAEGICRKQQATTDHQSRLINDYCLASIIGTRNLSGDELLQLGKNSRPLSKLPTKTSIEPNSLKWMIQQSYQDGFPSHPTDEEIFPFEI